eukprot:jgi/Mesvir1/13887/Mv16019-RA.2
MDLQSITAVSVACLCCSAAVYYIVKRARQPSPDVALNPDVALEVTCYNGDCHAAATKSCARCHVVYYCSRECQVRDYPHHKEDCKDWVAWEEMANEEFPPPLDLSEATELVGAVARQLNGTLDTPPDEDPPFKALQHVLYCMSGKSERVLARAGACELLASALDRALQGLSPVPLRDIVTSMEDLAGDSVKNKAVLGRLGVVSSLTRALRRAVRVRDDTLASPTLSLLSKLAKSKVSSLCEAFGAADTFEMAVECVVWASAPSPDTRSARFESCALLWALQAVADECTRPGCGNRARLIRNGPLFTASRGSRDRLFAALDACLSDAVAATESSIAETDKDVRDRIAAFPADRGAVVSVHLQVATADLATVCGAIHVLIAAQERHPSDRSMTPLLWSNTPAAVSQRGALISVLVRHARRLRRWFYGDVARSLASPRVCENLVRVLALARSPLWAHERDAMLQGATTSLVDPLPLHALVGDVAWMIYTLCEAHDHAAPFQTHGSCCHMVYVLWAANMENAHEGNASRERSVTARQARSTPAQRQPGAGSIGSQGQWGHGEENAPKDVQKVVLSAIWALARDDKGAAQLHAVGVCDHLVQSLRQGVERDDLDLVIRAARPLRRVITSVPDAPEKLAGSAYACWLLVKCAQMALLREGGGEGPTPPGRVGWPWPLICWVDFWWLMLSTHPACRQDFWAAGAADVLERVLKAPEVASDRESFDTAVTILARLDPALRK